MEKNKGSESWSILMGKFIKDLGSTTKKKE